MANVEITINLDSDLAPMFETEARGMARHPWVVRALEAHNFKSVDDLTPRQQAVLVLKFWSMTRQQQHKRREAEITHGEIAAQNIEAEFSIEVG